MSYSQKPKMILFDVGGTVFNDGMTPVLLDSESPVAFEIRTDGRDSGYLAVNHWNILKEHIQKL